MSKQSNVFKSDEGYDMYAEFYDQKSAYLNSFEEHVLLKMTKDLKGKRVLDMGCGTGRLISMLQKSGAEVVGLDTSEKMLKIARKKFPNVEFVRGDAKATPFENDSFDAVVAAFLIVHIPNPEFFFEEVYRVLKPGGVFILTNINQRKSPKLLVKDRKEIVIKSFYHLPEHIKKALESNFFKIEKEEFVYEKEQWVNQIIRAVKE